MLNGRNWWTDKPVEYEYNQNVDQRVEEAAKLIWDEWFGNELEDSATGPGYLAIAIRQAIQMVNNPGIDPRKFL